MRLLLFVGGTKSRANSVSPTLDHVASQPPRSCSRPFTEARPSRSEHCACCKPTCRCLSTALGENQTGELICEAGGGCLSLRTRAPTRFTDSEYASLLNARPKGRKLVQSTSERWKAFYTDTSMTQTRWSPYSFQNHTSPKKPSCGRNPHLSHSSCFIYRRKMRMILGLWSGIMPFLVQMAYFKAKWKPGGNALWTLIGPDGQACGSRIRGLQVGRLKNLGCTL